MTNEQLEQAIKTHFGALEVDIFELDFSSYLANLDVEGQAWRVWYTKEGVYKNHYIFDEMFFLVNGRVTHFPFKQRMRMTKERLMSHLSQYGKPVEEAFVEENIREENENGTRTLVNRRNGSHSNGGELPSTYCL